MIRGMPSKYSPRTNGEDAIAVFPGAHVVALDELKDADAKESNAGAEHHMPEGERDREGETAVGQDPFVEQDDSTRHGHP